MRWFNTQSWLLSSRVRSVILEYCFSSSRAWDLAVLIAAGGCKQRLLRYSEPADALMNAMLLLRHLSVASVLQVNCFLGHKPDRQPVHTVTWLCCVLLLNFALKGNGLLLKEKLHSQTTTTRLFFECEVTMWPPCKYKIYDLACIVNAAAQRRHLNSLRQAQRLLNIMILKLPSSIFLYLLFVK